MTTEEKAKAYDEAIKQAKYIKENTDYVGAKDVSAVIENIFPELKESEDERVRNILLYDFKNHGCDLQYTQGITYGDVVAWLEKQDHDGKKWMYEDDYNKEKASVYHDGITDVLDNPEKYGLISKKDHEEELEAAYRTADEVQYKRGYEAALKDFENRKLTTEDERIRKELIKYISENKKRLIPIPNDTTLDSWIAWLEKQGEQKPTDKVEPKFRVGDFIIRRSDSNCPVHTFTDDTVCKVVEVLDGHYILDTIEGRIQESFKWQDYYVLTDEKLFYKAFDNKNLYILKKVLRDANKGVEMLLGDKEYKQCINWLDSQESACGKMLVRGEDESACSYIERSLCPDYREVWYEACAEIKDALKPAEWSEEDEEMLKSVLSTCRMYEQTVDSSPGKHLLEMQEKWLKSLRPQKKQEWNKIAPKFIDLGLSSGTLWADRNIGADAPEKAGDYFRFGETVAFTENSPEYAFNNINENIAGTDRDAATVNLGKNYRMPTFEQIKELLDECKWKWTKQNGVKGMKVTGPNSNSIFFPASGYRNYGSGALGSVGSSGYCWSASPYSGNYGRNLYFFSSYWGWYYNYRAIGFPVRAVTKY